MADSIRSLPPRPSLEHLQKQAKDLLRQFRADSPTITLSEAQFVLAREYGFESWGKLKHFVEDLQHPRTSFPTDATAFGDAIQNPRITALNLSALALTDGELRQLAAMPQLEELDLSTWNGSITDRGLEVLRHLPRLRRIQLCRQPHITDAGVAHLAKCDRLEIVDLMGTPTGDGAIRALADKPSLRNFKTGQNVTPEGLSLLHEFPAFRTWQSGEPSFSLMNARHAGTQLLISGTFQDADMARLRGLDGLFALAFSFHCPNLTTQALAPLRHLSNLGLLAYDGRRSDDEAMKHIAAMPRLRYLMAQGAVAADSGFEALGRSRSLQYFWGAQCPHITGRGFAALAAIPTLRGLAVSCRHVDDAALSLLAASPELRELMPIDFSDDKFRHIGRCQALEDLWCMNCRETGDRATEYIQGLSRLKTYYAGRTQITDRSLEILSRMTSLERLEFWECAGITPEGLTEIAGLPKLQKVSLGGIPGVGRDAATLFPKHVQVAIS